jgi:parallel beta-helix repeat protein
MNREVILAIKVSTLLLILISSVMFARNGELLENFDIKAGNSAAYLSVPFYYQSNEYYCGPAALEMVFDYYGADIPQAEIADAARTYPYVTYTDELRRAAHFSNLSTSFGHEMPGNITGYTARKVGYAAFELWELNIEDLKSLINRGAPIIVLMWWTPAKVYGHYRVVVGYNETHIIMHDPWNKVAWEGTYGGPDTSMTYSTFLDLWEYIDYWGLGVYPWTVELQMPSNVNKGDNLEVKANITYPCLVPFDIGEHPASSCNATIELQEGLELASGEITQHSLGNIIAGDSVQTSWSIRACKSGSHNISVTVTGIAEGSVGAHDTYPSYNYRDEIGGSNSNSLSVTDQTYRVHNLDTDLNYTFIQQAIDAPETLDGHTIFVEKGTYHENLVVNKTVSLIGENRNDTVIDGDQIGKAVTVNANNTKISGFTIQMAGFTPWGSDSGIYLSGSNNYVTNDIIMNNKDWGIWIDSSSSNNTITYNDITNNWCGCMLKDTSGNTLAKNDITNHGQDGICLWNSSQNAISDNNVSNNVYGLALTSSHSNNIAINNITNNLHGVSVDSSPRNKFYHNNFMNNNQQVYFFTFSDTNSWDNGYPSGGNYWSDYNGTDVFSGPYQKQLIGSDGIGDTPYVIDVNNQDNYPLIGMFSNFNATSEHHVQTICNSTTSDFQFNGTAIRFNVSGENGTTGFCRICIPTALMNDTYRVFVNNTKVSYTLLPCSNWTLSYLYFTYDHSTQEVVIIPEFPSFLVLPLFMITTFMAIIIYKRRIHIF